MPHVVRSFAFVLLAGCGMSNVPDVAVDVERFSPGMDRVLYDVRFGGDVDGDGRGDLAAFRFDYFEGGTHLEVWSPADGNHWTVPRSDHEHLGELRNFALGGDLDGDGLADVIATSTNAAATPIVRAFSPLNGVLYEQPVDPSCWAIEHITVGQVDGDLGTILTAASCEEGTRIDLRNAQFEVVRTWFEPTFPERVEFTPDRDGDGLSDVLFIGGRGTCVAFGSVSGEELGRFALDSFRPELMACDDLDGDGAWDGIEATEGGPVLRLANGTTRAILDGPGSAFPLGDVDGDGSQELWVIDEVALQVRVEGLRGRVRFIEPVDYDREIRIDPTRDLNGDGLRELGIANRGGSTGRSVVLRFEVP